MGRAAGYTALGWAITIVASKAGPLWALFISEVCALIACLP